MRLRPSRDRVALSVSIPDQTKSGLWIPQHSREAPDQGEVLAVGCDVDAVKPGDRVLFQKLEGDLVNLGDGQGEFLVLHQKHLRGIVEA